MPQFDAIGIVSSDIDTSRAFYRLLGFLPPTSPIAMPVRWAASEVPIGQLALSMALLVATLLGITWVAARIYRVGILMYGKRHTVAELLRWVRTPG